jgi:hypothetical protein
MSSKLLVFAAFLVCWSTAGCGNSTKNAAEEHAAQVDDAISHSATSEVLLPGMKPGPGSMPEGCYLRAVIDGKKWEATEMTPDRSNLSLITVNGKNGNSSITFVISGKRDNIGQPSNLSESNHITYWGGEGFFVGAQSGQFTVTNLDDQFIDGTFNFTAEKDGRKVECTDGQFRIPAPASAPTN